MLDSPYPRVLPGPPRPSRILTPHGLIRQSGRERHVVPGGAALLLAVQAGDLVQVVNDEGAQPCDLVAAGLDGVIDAGVMGRTANNSGEGVRALATGPLRQALARRQIDLGTAGAIRLFDLATLPKAQETLTATRGGHLIIAAPGLPMSPWAQDTATPLTVLITRANPALKPLFDLPDPLADPLQDIRVTSSTARAYHVKAGEFIQIIDVNGRQMTDFQCFSARKIDAGLQRPLDVTTSRTFMGHAYSMPGLHSKYFDQDFEPLVEVYQDTVGRHDAFAMACSPKYYDDIGYPGHTNCSDNFNFALQGTGVEGRPGWMAVNFFYNTWMDAHGVLSSDEAWSRPGDFVMMRALTDLICVSSACPDDTTAGNGWNPTDIHVRVYSDTETFSRAVAWRTTPDAEPKMSKETAFHSRTSALTRNMVEYKGYWLPQAYREGPIAEYWACREKVAVIDLSPLRKWEITGPDSEALLQYCLTRDVKKLSQGQIVYSAMCYEHGGMIDDGTLFRLGQDNFRWIGGDEFGGVWLRDQAEKLGLKVLVRSSTDQLHNIAVQGPNSRELLSRIIWTAVTQPAVTELGWFRFAVARLGGPAGAPLVVSRTGYTGELGYEIFCHPKDAEAVYDAVMAAGADLGVLPMGLAALDMVRIEAGLIFAGYDFSDQTDPFEAGIGFTVPLKSKPDDFIGRDALIRRKEHPRAKFIGLDIDSAVTVGHGDPVQIGRAQVGVVCSAMRSPLLGKQIALARIDLAHAEVGTSVEVGKLDGQQKRLPASVVALSHYDPKKTRPQS
jgi:aminomethyltransferase